MNPVAEPLGKPQKMKFFTYLRCALLSALQTCFALGLLLLFLTLAGLNINGDITLELDITITDGVWGLLVIPAVLCVLTLVVAPLAYLLIILGRRLGQLLRKQHGTDDPAPPDPQP